MATQTIGRLAGGHADRGSSQRERGLFGNITPDKLADSLGWFSIALGAADLLAPGAMSRAAGVNNRHGALLRLIGLREIASGIMILSGARAAGCWSRVAGGLM